MNEIACFQKDLHEADEENSQLQELVQEWEDYCQNLEDNREQKKQELTKYKSDIEGLKTELESERKKYKGYHATTSTEIQNLQQQKGDCKAHIRKMSQIISKLSSRGLPEHRDDRYFMEKLDDLVVSISQWARLFSRDRPPLTTKDVSTVKISTRVKEYIVPSFLDVWSLLNAKNVGGKVRTRFVEVIILRTLMGDRLWKQHIGFPVSYYESHSNLMQGMTESCTGKSYCLNYCLLLIFRILEEQIRAWSALTIHNLTKNDENLRTEREKDIDAITDMLLSDLSPFGGSTESTLATREQLRQIVCNVAELGLEIAKLPFEIWPEKLTPGGSFEMDTMQNVDPQVGLARYHRTTIIVSFPWVKAKYYESGTKMFDRTYLNKARVSCIC